ncbi:peptidyl-prolyl cis-trans isomerase [Arcobacter lacus]|uniref:foldase protein PrsA n=1 Tax=Arcobacter lacus TaxID=1912876 RepID=UPI0021BB2C93|nr:peptidyl-prolyl cis-trans isomerase [Arcobacter lacus]MCT7908400.1 peptidyl-prolyl cis-trans isomerase [Arcobacter lacus]
MKKIVSSLVASIALATVLNAADVTYATVNGENITKQDIVMALQNPNIDFDKVPQEAKTQILDQIVNMKLIAQHAIDDGIEKDTKYVEAMKRIKSNLALEVWQKNEIDKVKVTEADKKDFYEKNKEKFVEPETFEASHILVKTEAEAKDIISQLDKAPNKVEKFKELSKKSLDTASAKVGGALGRFAVEQMVPEFGNSVKTLAKGTYTKTPVKTQFGYHVIYLKDKFPSKTFTYAEVEKNINQVLIGNALNKKIKELVEDLRKDAKIVIK